MTSVYKYIYIYGRFIQNSLVAMERRYVAILVIITYGNTTVSMYKDTTSENITEKEIKRGKETVRVDSGEKSCGFRFDYCLIWLKQWSQS